MIRTLRLALGTLFLFVSVAGAQTPTQVAVTGHFQNPDGTVPSGLSLQMQLNNCAGGAPRVFGVSSIVASTQIYSVDPGTGQVNGAIWPNDVIDCGGVTGQSRWALTQVIQNIPQTLPLCYNVLEAAPLNLDTATVCPNFNPPTPPGTAHDGTFNNLSVLGMLTMLGGGTINASNINATNLIAQNLHITGTISGTFTAINPQSVNGLIFADSFPGATIDVKVKNAFASAAGISGTPTPSAVVYLAPGQTYSYSAPLEIPNESSAPFISRPILDCNGSTLYFTGTGSGTEAVLVHGMNVGSSATDSGQMRNCVVSRPDATGPVMVNNDRMGWYMSNVALYGGQDSYYVNLTTLDGGPSYLEQSYLENVALMNPARDGIRVHNGTGGNGGYQYNTGDKLRFQFNGDGHAEIHFEAGVNAFNGLYSTQLNTGGLGTTYIIQADAGAVVLSTEVRYNGEGSTALRFGGGGSISAQCQDIARMQVDYDALATCSAPWQSEGEGTGLYGRLSGTITSTHEDNFAQGQRTNYGYDNGDNWVRFHSKNGGFENGGTERIASCVTGVAVGQANAAIDSALCTNVLFQFSDQGFGIGPGFFDTQTAVAQRGTPRGQMDISGRFFTDHLSVGTGAGTPGLSTTVTLTGCTMTFVEGVLTAKSGGC